MYVIPDILASGTVRRTFLNILILILISFTSPQQIDMLAIEDTLFIAMEESFQVTLYRYESTTLITEADLGYYTNISIGHSGDVDDQIILVACSDVCMKGYNDSLYAFNPDDLSLIWKTGDLPSLGFEPLFQTRFIERWISEPYLPRLICYYCTHVTDGDEQWIFSCAFNPNTYPVIWEDNLYMDSDIQGYVDDLFFGPVKIPDEPVITGLVNNVSAPVAWPNFWWVEIHVHEAETDSMMRVLPVAGGQYEQTPFYPRGYCLGSCSSHAVMLWSDTTETIYSTEVAGSPLEIVSTEPFDFSLPTGYAAITASRNPNDTGILLCYYRDGYIWARYMEDFWFSYEHQVAPATFVYTGNLTVSGTPDGYWIAWNNSSKYPNIAWIDRETLTGISESQSGTIGNLCLTTAPNPFFGILEVTVISGGMPVQIDIYDTSGHRVHSENTDNSGYLTWDAQSMPAGVYLIRAIHAAEHVDSKVLLIR